MFVSCLASTPTASLRKRRVRLSAGMLLVVLTCCLSLAVVGQDVDNDWIDPYDMINYDASTKTMKKPAETVNYVNVPTKRREHTQEDSSPVELTQCRTQIEDLMKKNTLISQQPTCNPVFKRFLTRLRKEIQRVGSPSDSADLYYDAKIRLSTQAMTEIQTFLEGEEGLRTGALDNAISQILVDVRPHDYNAWKWRFEDTFGLELDTILKLGLGFLIIVAIICTQLWSMVSWFVQFYRLFAVSFFVSVFWNWLYLYKIAFADHQRNIAKMDDVYEKCSGVKKIDWIDSLKEFYRSTLTLQDDPCKKYYEAILVNPILMVPPTKAIAVTITTVITEPLKHIGQGISEFLVALLKDLPITLQIPVLITIVLAIVVCVYGSVQAAFLHGIAAPFRRPRRDPPPPQLEGPGHHVQEIEDGDHLAEGDAQRHVPRQQALRQRANGGRLQADQDVRRRVHRRIEEPARRGVETLGTAEDEADFNLREVQRNLSAASENLQDTQEDLEGESAGAVADTTQSTTNPAESDAPSNAQPLHVKEKLSEDRLSRDRAATRSQPVGTPPSQTNVELCKHTTGMVNIHMQHKLDLHPIAEHRTDPVPLLPVENIRVSSVE